MASVIAEIVRPALARACSSAFDARLSVSPPARSPEYPDAWLIAPPPAIRPSKQGPIQITLAPGREVEAAPTGMSWTPRNAGARGGIDGLHALPPARPHRRLRLGALPRRDDVRRKRVLGGRRKARAERGRRDDRLRARRRRELHRHGGRLLGG